MDAEPQALVVGDKLEEAAAGSLVGLQDIDPAAVFASVLSQEPIAAATDEEYEAGQSSGFLGSAAEEKPGQGFLATLMACGVLTADEVAMVKGSTLEDGPVKPKPKPKGKAKLAKPKPSASNVAKKGNARAKPATAQQAEEEPAGEDEDAAELPVVRTLQKKPAKKIPCSGKKRTAGQLGSGGRTRKRTEADGSVSKVQAPMLQGHRPSHAGRQEQGRGPRDCSRSLCQDRPRGRGRSPLRGQNPV